MILNEITSIQTNAELIYSAKEVDVAIEKTAVEINSVLKDTYPLVLCMMIGSIVYVGKLLPLLTFPLQLEYVHATRYHNKQQSGQLKWLKKLDLSLHDRTVLIVDDILDQGITLDALTQVCKDLQAKKIHTTVLADKQIDRPRKLVAADFTALTVPDRYVFGYGMDYKGHLRNAHGIYAVRS